MSANCPEPTLSNPIELKVVTLTDRVQVFIDNDAAYRSLFQSRAVAAAEGP